VKREHSLNQLNELNTIAHDLSNVLAAIRAFATVIREERADDDVARRDTDQILLAVDQGVALTKRLLALRGP
jgi:hypothetical protein